MKKVLALLLVVAMVMASLAGCGGGAAASSAPADTAAKTEDAAAKTDDAAPAAEASGDVITVNWFAAMYSDGTEAFLRDAFDKFEAENPGIKVNMEIVGWDNIEERAVSLIGSNQAPDVMNGNGYSGYDDDGLLYAVEDIVSPELIADIMPDFYNNNKNADGVAMALPYLASVRNLYYSKPIFEECGIEKAPATWAEVEEDCKIILEKYNGEVYPWGLDATMTEGETMTAYYGWNAGGYFVDENDKWDVANQGNIDGLTFAKHLYDMGYTNANPCIELRDDMQKIFGEGKMAMLLTANFFPTLYPDLDLGIAPLPVKNAGDTPVTIGVQDGVCFFNDLAKAEKDTPEKLEAIKKVTEYFYSPEVYVDYMEVEGMLPATLSGAQLLVERDANKQGYLDALSSARFYPTYKPEWEETMNAFCEVAQKVITDAATPEEALQTLQDSLEKYN